MIIQRYRDSGYRIAFGIHRFPLYNGTRSGKFGTEIGFFFASPKERDEEKHPQHP